MARAKRHYIPGHVWHITHRCHKREFLFKFEKDRHCWLQWLYKAKKRYGLVILNYVVTSNHIHLLVQDPKGMNIIPRSIQLVAGRTGQAYNNRKKRKGAFWEDRYHATAIETGDYLLRCIVYMDLNMVRAGVVAHPERWKQCGYNEIQKPRRKNILIDYAAVSRLCGFYNFEQFQSTHQRWVQSALSDDKIKKENCWTQSIATGTRAFIEAVKMQMCSKAMGRSVRENEKGFELREPQTSYNALFRAEKVDIEGENLWYWDE